MDTIAHGLVGIHVANLGFRRRLGTKISYWVAAVAANAPDLDIVLLAKGRAEYTYFHRGITHSAVALLVLPPLIAAVAARITKASFKDLLALCMLAQVSHLVLDVLNFWGTMLGSPFIDHRYATPWVFVFDVFVWLLLAIPLVLSWRGFLAPRNATALGFGMLGAYVTLCALFHAAAVEATAHAAELVGVQPKSVEAYPRPLFPTHWNGVVTTADQVVQVDVDVLAPSPAKTVRVFARNLADPWVERALKTDVGRLYPWFAPELIAAPPGEGDKRQVGLYDMRFFPPPWAKLSEARNSLYFPVAHASLSDDAPLAPPAWGAPWPEPLHVYRDGEFGAARVEEAAR